MASRPFVAETYDRLLRDQLPNLFRLYLNPFVTQTCYCLNRYVQTTWPPAREPFQTFLANSFDEALSGAIKLARYSVNEKRPGSTTGLLIDPDGDLGPFVSASAGQAKVVFIPGLTVVGSHDEVDAAAKTGQSFGFVVLLPGAMERYAELAQRFVRDGALIIACVDRRRLKEIRARAGEKGTPPDIVVFDESFTNHDVPFGAFAARKSLYDLWNTSSKSTFHSTTFQPNTVSSLHFMRCLEKDDPEFHTSVADDLRLIETDLPGLRTLFSQLYSPSLAGAIAATRCETLNVHATGDFVYIDDRKIFDGISGVACSVRGHNPDTYAAEMDALADHDCEAEALQRMRDLTGLDCMLPAVSGACAVEMALKIGLVAQFPRRHILALKAGFGGKTLFALTGTWNSAYKQHVEPLYAEVVYIDPFAPDALEQVDKALAQHEFAIAQTELIQGVGGVRRVPEAVMRHLAAGRQKHGYLLLVDEVQTGMYRTGPFAMSIGMGLAPDLLAVGKAISDMMFPFAQMLYTTNIQAKLDQAGSDLPAFFRKRNGYALGYRTMVNVLRIAEKERMAERVAQSSALFEQLLKEELANCKCVREVRVYGLLLGIELDITGWPQRWFKKRLFWFYLAAMFRHPSYPLLVGFSQYEPNVLKITPPLLVDPGDVKQVCATIGEVVRRPFSWLLASSIGGLFMASSIGRFLRLFRLWSTKHDHVDKPAHETAAR